MSLIYSVFYNGEKEGRYDGLKEARDALKEHKAYKRIYFTRKGKATSSNPNEKDRFFIVDNNGGLYTIRN